MLQTIEAIIEPDGKIRLLEAIHPNQPMRVLITLLEPLMETSTETPLHNFAGLLANSTAFSDEPINIQRALRDEWD